MSRALNIDASVADVIAMAARHDVVISAIEQLVPAGTRVVCVNGDGAATIARAFGKKVLTGSVTRSPWGQQLVT